MILNEGQLSNTNCPLPSHAFTIQNSPLAFEILSSRLYSDPMLAIVRELLTNAYDAQVMAGNADTPIDISLPDYLNPYFKIRDYGIGLDKDEVMLLYTSFFSSTKNTTNDFTGCFGLGSKTPFSYTSGFTVNSYKNGYKHKFMMVKKDMMPQVIHVGSEKVDEPNGLEIVIPVAEGDYSLFAKTTASYLANIPEIKTTCDDKFPRESVEFSFYPFEGMDDFCQLLFIRKKSSSYANFYNWFLSFRIKQGQNIYDVTELLNNKVREENGLSIPYLASLSHTYKIILEVPIGTFEITPNREMIDSTAKTINKLADILIKVNDRLFRYDIPRRPMLPTDDHIENLRIITDNLKDTIIGRQIDEINSSYNYSLKHHTNDQETVIVWSKSGGRIYKYSKSIYHIIREETYIASGISLVIDVPVRQKSSKLTKLIYRLVNYEKEFSKYDNIYINYINTVSNSLSDTRYVGEVRRTFKKAVKDINKIVSRSYNIIFTDINRIVRKYPNGEIPDILRPSKYVRPTQRIAIRLAQIPNYYISYSNKYEYYKHIHLDVNKSLRSINDINTSFSPNNTIIFYDEEIVKDNVNWVEIIEKLGDCPNEDTGRPSFEEFLEPYRAKLNHSGHIFNIFSISKSHVKNFPNYTVISVKDLIKYYQSIKIRIRHYNTDWMLEVLACSIDSFVSIYSEKLQEKLRNTSIYKKLGLVKKLLHKVREYDYDNFRYSTSYYNEVIEDILKESNVKAVFIDLTKITKSIEPCIKILKENKANRYDYGVTNTHKALTRKGKLLLLQKLLGV